MAYYQKKIGDKTRSSGLMKMKALGKSSMLFNLGKPGSPATMPTACGGEGQPECAEFEDVLGAIENTGRYSNAQDVQKLNSYGKKELQQAKKAAKAEIGIAEENSKASKKAYKDAFALSPYGRYTNEASKTEGTELNYLKSLADRDLQIQKNKRILRDNLNNAIKNEYINSFSNSTAGDVKRKNRKYLKEAYAAYLAKGDKFTSQNDFTAYAESPYTVGMFQNTTEDEY